MMAHSTTPHPTASMRSRRRIEALDVRCIGALYSPSIETRVAAASRPDAEASHGEAGDRLRRKSGAVPQL